jgi:hypothetical protein
MKAVKIRNKENSAANKTQNGQSLTDKNAAVTIQGIRKKKKMLQLQVFVWHSLDHSIAAPGFCSKHLRLFGYSIQ